MVENSTGGYLGGYKPDRKASIGRELLKKGTRLGTSSLDVFGGRKSGDVQGGFEKTKAGYERGLVTKDSGDRNKANRVVLYNPRYAQVYDSIIDGCVVTAVFNRGATYHQVKDLKQAEEDAKKKNGMGRLRVYVYTGSMTAVQVKDVKSTGAQTFNNRKNLENYVAKGYG
jgi:hypothetical protein